MASDVFVDKLVDITVTGAIVRIDFANQKPASSGDDNNDSKALIISQRLIMPIEGFVQMSEAISKMIALMIEKGTLINRNSGSEHKQDMVDT